MSRRVDPGSIRSDGSFWAAKAYFAQLYRSRRASSLAGVVSTVIIRRFVFIAFILEEATRRTALNEFINEEQTATATTTVTCGGGNAILIRTTLRLKDGHRLIK